MTENLVESKEEMKKKMKKLKKEKEKLSNKPSESSPSVKIETKKSLSPNKQKTPGKNKSGLYAEQRVEEKEEMQNIKEETSARTEKLRRQSEKEGRNPAEKFLSDIFTGFKQKTEDVSQSMTENGTTQPATDILETDEAITIISDIPGLKKDNIELGITQTSVEITATYKEEPTIVNANFIQKERSYGVVHRTLNLPSPINIGKATANYKNCILTINLPKEEKDLTKIKIQE